MFNNKNFELKPNSRGEYDIGRGTCLTSSLFRLILVGSIYLFCSLFNIDLISLSLAASLPLKIGLLQVWRHQMSAHRLCA
jgi:hypothetical protein